jgi:hypothetical protein
MTLKKKDMLLTKKQGGNVMKKLVMGVVVVSMALGGASAYAGWWGHDNEDESAQETVRSFAEEATDEEVDISYMDEDMAVVMKTLMSKFAPEVQQKLNAFQQEFVESYSEVQGTYLALLGEKERLMEKGALYMAALKVTEKRVSTVLGELQSLRDTLASDAKAIIPAQYYRQWERYFLEKFEIEE